jgi:hypothetical protein
VRLPAFCAGDLGGLLAGFTTRSCWWCLLCTYTQRYVYCVDGWQLHRGGPCCRTCQHAGGPGLRLPAAHGTSGAFNRVSCQQQPSMVLLSSFVHHTGRSCSRVWAAPVTGSCGHAAVPCWLSCLHYTSRIGGALDCSCGYITILLTPAVASHMVVCSQAAASAGPGGASVCCTMHPPAAASSP